MLKEQTKLRDYDSPRSLCIGKIYDFPKASGLLRIQARLHARRHVYLICCIAALRDSRSQALNSNLLGDKFSVNTSSKTKICRKLQKVELESTLRNMLPQLATL